MRSFLIVACLCVGVWTARPAFAAPTPRMLLEVADLANIAISPDGRSVAFRQMSATIESNTYRTVWYTLSLDRENRLRRVADGGLPLRNSAGWMVVEKPLWSPDSHWVYYRALLDGEIQVWRAARDGSRTEAVTSDAANVESFELSKDGRLLLYTVGAPRAEIVRAEEREYDSGIRVDGTVHMGQGVYRSDFVDGRLATRRLAGLGFFYGTLLSDRPKRHKILDLQSLAVRDAGDSDEALFAHALEAPKIQGAENVETPVRSVQSGHIAYLERSGKDPAYRMGHVLRLKMVTDGTASSAVTCSDAACQQNDIVGLAWRPGGKEVIFTSAEYSKGRAQTMYAWNPARNAVRLISRADGLLNGGEETGLEQSCALGEQLAVCVAASANAPPRLVSVDLDNGKTRVLFDPNGALAAAAGPRVEQMTWQDERGRTVSGQFFPAVSATPGKPAPLVIVYYQCDGFLRGGTGDEWPFAALAGQGIAALCINHMPGYLLDAVERYGTGLSAVRSVVDILARAGRIDRTRVGMGGLSFGSEVALWVAMKSDLLAAVSVSSASLTSTYYWFTALQRDNYKSMVRRFWGVGAPEETPERWREISPAYQTKNIKAALLLQMPEEEYLQAMDYVTPLIESTTPTDLYVFPEEPHKKIQPRHKLAVYERNVDWFRFWLQGYVDPNPHKAEQYRLWEAMRERSPEHRAAKSGG